MSTAEDHEAAAEFWIRAADGQWESRAGKREVIDVLGWSVIQTALLRAQVHATLSVAASLRQRNSV